MKVLLGLFVFGCFLYVCLFYCNLSNIKIRCNFYFFVTKTEQKKKLLNQISSACRKQGWCGVQWMMDRQHRWPESPVHHQGLRMGTSNTGVSSNHAGSAESHLGLPSLLCLRFTGCVWASRFTCFPYSPRKWCVLVSVQGAEPPMVHSGSCFQMVSCLS